MGQSLSHDLTRGYLRDDLGHVRFGDGSDFGPCSTPDTLNLDAIPGVTASIRAGCPTVYDATTTFSGFRRLQGVHPSCFPVYAAAGACDAVERFCRLLAGFLDETELKNSLTFPLL